MSWASLTGLYVPPQVLFGMKDRRRCNLIARYFRPNGVRRLLLVLLLLVIAGCGPASVGPAPSSPEVAPAVKPLDPFALIGWWRVEGNQDIVGIDPSGIYVDTPAGTTTGNWNADTGGRFLAGFFSFLSGPIDTPVARATAYTVDDADRELRGPDGAVLVKLLPGAAPNDAAIATAVDPSRAPTPEQRRAAQTPKPLPAGLRPANPRGNWVPLGWTGATTPGVEFRTDGTFGASDGCNSIGGRWLVGPDGGLLVAAATAMTLVGCPGVPVPSYVQAARLAGLDGETLVLLDANGAETVRLTRQS